MIEKIVIEKLPESSRRYPKFRFRQRRPSGRMALEVEGIAKSYGENVVLKDVSLKVERGDRLAIIGPHGIVAEDIVVVGQSVGAVLLAAWAHDYAPRIRAMVLAAPAFSIIV